MVLKDLIKHRIQELNDSMLVLQSDQSMIDTIKDIAKLLINALYNRNRVYLCGNGGSAADAQHLAAELIGRFKLERKSLPVEALTVNTSILTALANDYDYSLVFARQIEGLGSAGDICIGLSTSGNSKNIFLALQAAKKINMKTVSIVGQEGGTIESVTDICLKLPSKDTPHIQEMTIMVGHILCEIVEASIVNGAPVA